MDYFVKVKLEMPSLIGRRETCHYYGFSTSLVDENIIIGRLVQKRRVVDMLLCEPELQNVSVITVTGMGGIGKTTFAQLLFNDKQVTDTFTLRIWVSMSVKFDLTKITKSIIESVLKKKCELTELEPLQSTLQALLQHRKFLLVLDGFWSEEYADWDKLSSPFKLASKGSKVIITTRSDKVSRVVGAESFLLPTLHDEDCWKLIKQKVAFNQQLHSEEVGLDIAKKCGGLPLVANMLGCLLCCIPDEWHSILNSQLWDLTEYEKYVFPNLLISYYFLSPNLKRCFVYCSLFPRDYEFEVHTLVQLWVAEGLIQPIGERRLEDVGREYFNDLLGRSFFYRKPQDPQDPQDPKKLYKMHVFIHNMAQVVSVKVCHRMENMSFYDCLENFRHLSVCSDNVFGQLKKFPKCTKLRTFLWLCRTGANITQRVKNICKKFIILRVLDLSFGGITELNGSICSLKHLKYLNLSSNNIKKLPDQIVRLSLLETLVLKHCPLLLDLPADFNKLTSLRHLEFDVSRQLSQMPIKLGNLVNLQTLYAFIVGEGEGYRIEELKDMKYLGGSLCITRLENASHRNTASVSLNRKPHIEKLELTWEQSGNSEIHCEVLNGLQPHEKLKELIITGYCGQAFPQWLHDRHNCKLKVLHLISCQQCVSLPLLGGLQFLEHLLVKSMPAVKIISAEFCGEGDSVAFQSLKSLIISDMPLLTKWECLKGMPLLCDLKLENCPKLITISPLNRLSSLRKLEILWCAKLRRLPYPGLPFSVQSIFINDCPRLQRRCMLGGKDWYKVIGVPLLVIDAEIMPTAPQRA